MNKKIEIYSLISGLVFLISGIAKSLDIAFFSNIIAQYGFENLKFLSPIIVLAEVLLGLLLVFQIHIKWTAFVSGLLVAAFTFIYSYGLIVRGVEDCGCFGEISFLNTSPVLIFIRNAILIFLLTVVWWQADNKERINRLIVGIILLVMCIAAFMSGYGFRFVTRKKTNEKAEKIVDTNLKEFVTFSRDSTYLVFVFTYTCPHCMNSIENLKKYESSGVVDKVLGIALEDSIAEQKFKEIFTPNFTIRNYPAKQLFRLTKSFPVTYYLRRDSIIMTLPGELPCSYVFDKMMK